MKRILLLALSAVVATSANVEAQTLILGLNANAIDQGDSTPVTMWNNGYGSAAQAVVARQPTFLASSTPLGGNSAVSFDDIDDGMTTSVSGLGTEYTIMTLYAYRQTTTNAARVVQGGNGTFNAQGGASANNWLLGPYTGQHRFYDGAFISSGDNTTDPVIATAVGSIGFNNEFYLDGALIGSNGNNNQPNFVGLGTEGAWAEPADSDVGAVLVFDTPLSMDERIGVESILAAEFGLDGFNATHQQILAGRAVLDGFRIAVPEPASIAAWIIAGALAVFGFRFYRRKASA